MKARRWRYFLPVVTGYIRNWALVILSKQFFLQAVIFVALQIYSVTGQRQSLTIGRSAHFSLQWLLRVWGNPHLLNEEFQMIQCSCRFLSTEFAACSKPLSREYHRKASYVRTLQRLLPTPWYFLFEIRSLSIFLGKKMNKILSCLGLRQLIPGCLGIHRRNLSVFEQS